MRDSGMYSRVNRNRVFYCRYISQKRKSQQKRRHRIFAVTFLLIITIILWSLLLLSREYVNVIPFVLVSA